jgi:lysozyme
MKITKIDNKGIELITSFEGFRSKPYLCPANVPTIGYGTTRYPTGIKVSLKDTAITKEQALIFLKNDISFYEKAVDSLCNDNLTQNQFNALVSFTYNLGANALKTSSLLKKVNTNRNDPTIKNNFLLWVFGGDGTRNSKDDDGDGLIDEIGEKLKLEGLIRRRTAEANLYFT